ncbi:hypothetical protein [Chromobacterium haemolyticum]|nr:hypothetical protein [Chromobacterium haemolyticum]
MVAIDIPAQFLTDESARLLRAEGWTIKCPFFVKGHAVFPAFRRA